jgi:hypothetical protein
LKRVIESEKFGRAFVEALEARAKAYYHNAPNWKAILAEDSGLSIATVRTLFGRSQRPSYDTIEKVKRVIGPSAPLSVPDVFISHAQAEPIAAEPDPAEARRRQVIDDIRRLLAETARLHDEIRRLLETLA